MGKPSSREEPEEPNSPRAATDDVQTQPPSTVQLPISRQGSDNRSRIAGALNPKAIFISPNEVHFGEKIGSGGSGIVRKATWRGTEVAVKQLFLSSMGELDLKEMELLMHEAAVFAALRHPNVALFMGACFEPPNCFLVTQLYPRGSLEDLLYDKTQQLDWPTRCCLAGAPYPD